jgi:hypothetical protein
MTIAIGCDEQTNEVPVDAPPRPMCQGSNCNSICDLRQITSCQGSTARVFFLYTSPNCPPVSSAPPAVCASGCLVEFTTAQSYWGVPHSVYDPAVFCAETPEARVGDPCTTFSEGLVKECLPTRAQVDANGVVIGQTYLACGVSTCASRPPPIVPEYLAPCPTDVVEQHGGNNVNGIVGAGTHLCLLAWDAVTQTTKSGKTISCLGDWECPQDALCDDLGVSFFGACKPGPRGVLTPAMLSM